MKAFWLVIGLSAYASAGWAVTYGELLPRVVEKLPEIQQLSGLAALSNANLEAANSLLAGEVEFNLKHENDHLSGRQGLSSWEGGVTLPIWWSGQSNRHAEVGTGYQQQTQTQQAHLSLLASKQLRQLVWQAHKADERLKFAKRNLKQSQSLVDLVNRKVEVGDRPVFDLLLAKKSLLA